MANKPSKGIGREESRSAGPADIYLREHGFKLKLRDEGGKGWVDRWHGDAAAGEAELIQLSKTGDHAAQMALLEMHTGFIISIVRRREPRCSADFDDLMQVAFIGFLRGIQLFDPNRGTTLLTYAGRRARAEVLEELRDSHLIRIPPRRLRKGLQRPQIAFTGQVEKMDRWRARKWPAYEADYLDLLREVLAGLKKRVRLFFKYRFMQEMTLQEAGRRLGLTRERVRQIEEEWLPKLRERMERALRVGQNTASQQRG